MNAQLASKPRSVGSVIQDWRPEDAAFSRAHATMPRAASTWQTLAPADAAASVAAPV